MVSSSSGVSWESDLQFEQVKSSEVLNLSGDIKLWKNTKNKGQL